MSARIEIVPATIGHAHTLAPVMRLADRLEAEAALGLSPLDGLKRSLASSVEAWAGMADGELVCIFGLSYLNVLAGEGCPWLLGSDLVERHSRAFLRRNKVMVAHWLEVFPVLRNHVDARHTVAVRWLRWLKFTILPPVPYGPLRLPFHPFEMRSADAWNYGRAA